MDKNLFKLCTFPTKTCKSTSNVPSLILFDWHLSVFKNPFKVLKNKESLQTNKSVQMGSILEHAARQPGDKRVRQEDIVGW